jgi:hypothetical protein
MLHLISGNPMVTAVAVKAIASLYKSTDTHLETCDFSRTKYWNLDAAMDWEDGILYGLEHQSFQQYLDASSIQKFRNCICWQILSGDWQESNEIIGFLPYLASHKVAINYLLPESCTDWKNTIERLSQEAKKIIRMTGSRLSMMPTLDLEQVEYTLPDGSSHRSLLVGVTRLSPEDKATIKTILEIFLVHTPEPVYSQR